MRWASPAVFDRFAVRAARISEYARKIGSSIVVVLVLSACSHRPRMPPGAQVPSPLLPPCEGSVYAIEPRRLDELMHRRRLITSIDIDGARVGSFAPDVQRHFSEDGFSEVQRNYLYRAKPRLGWNAAR
jgi:hypothetical protein